MSQAVRVSKDVYEGLRKEAAARGVPISQLASERFSDNKDRHEVSDGMLTGAGDKGTGNINSTGQPLQVTLVDKRQDARIDSLEEHVKQLSAGVISNRVGILHLADDKADEVDSVMTGAYNKLLELGFTDIAKEVKRLSAATRDGDLDEDDDLEYYDEGDEDEDE
jgi:hypothetical protein